MELFMSKPEIVLVAPMMPTVMEVLGQRYTVHRLYQAEDPAAFLAEVGGAVRAIATNGHAGADAALMDALPELEIIASYGVGYDAVDVPHALARGVTVTNTPDVLNDDVANLAVGLLLASSRDIVSGDRHVRNRRWLQGDMPLSRGIRNKPVGILGLGRIGKNIARKLEVFGCDLAYHGRRAQTDQPYRYYPDLVEMARDCDYLIVICPASPETQGLVGRAVIDALGPEGTLINVARGSIVDEPELVQALTDGRLGAAALDVFADEPRVPDALFDMDNVILQPHVGSATGETRQAMGDLVLKNLALHFDGEPVATPVSG
jgi:lactate dehydrogenase-like 2-hydroxyacid dehydrogenase